MIEKFFGTLYADKLPKDHILIWEKYNKRSSWFTNVPNAIDFIRESADHDIYVGCGVSPRSFGEKKRCDAEQIAGIPGLWLDLDTKHPVQKKKSLPETEEDIQKILSVFPLEPTFDINSGHGRQFWWAFKEFWSFESEEERMKAADLMHRFNIMFRDNAKKLGFELDMVHDLARIMRIPGTINVKDPTSPVPVVILKHNDISCNPGDIEELLPEKAVPALFSPGRVVKTPGHKFVLDPMANPPWDKFHVLSDLEPLFEASWNMKRRFQGGKESASEYDLSLAAFAFQAGWSWQEVVDLLVAFRRKHGLKPKIVVEGDFTTPLREDYYIRTLTVAEKDVVRLKAQENIDDYVNNIGAVRKLPPDQQPAAIKANLTDILGFPCDRLVMQMTTPPDVRMETPMGNIQLGEPKNLIDQRKFREHVANLQILFKPVAKKTWWNIAAALLAACERECMGEGSTLSGITRGWLRQYLRAYSVNYDYKEAIKEERPGIKENMFFLVGSSLREWLWLFLKERVSAKEMGIKLRSLGLEPTVIYVSAVSTGGKPSSREVWGISASAPFLEEFVDVSKVKVPAKDETTGG